MATAKRVDSVVLELSMEEAKFLYDLLYRRIGGSGYYRNGLDKIYLALAQAGVDTPDLGGHGMVSYIHPNDPSKPSTFDFEKKIGE